MPVLMPCEPGNPRVVDPAWALESQALQALGILVVLLDHDALQRGEAGKVFRPQALAAHVGSKAAWRGWMMSAEAYSLLCDLAEQGGLRMLDGDDAYSFCHHGPRSITTLQPWMAPTHLVAAHDPVAIERLLRGLGERALVLKDWVKSEAGLWAEACFIPRADDIPAARRVIDRFIEIRNHDLVGGLVLREFRPLRLDSKGRALEWRSFVVDGKPVLTFGRTPDALPELGPSTALLQDVAARVAARFWTMDWAVTTDGHPLLLEIGYGGVSGIPEDTDPVPMLRALGTACLV